MSVAVRIVCTRGDRVAEVAPFPAQGPAQQIEIVRLPARYRPGAAAYVADTPVQQTKAGRWETVPRKPIRLSLQAFDAGEWGTSLTWACRCGLNQIDPHTVIAAAWEWSAERRRGRADPRTRVVVLQRA